MQGLLVLRRHALPGAIGSTVLAIGALAMGWIPPLFNVEHWLVLGVLRTTTGGEILGRGAVLIGGALLLQSWLLLGTDVLGDRIASVPALQRTLALWIAPALLVPPLFSRDAYSYYIQGRLLERGLDPYTHGAAAVPGWFLAGVDPMWGETPTPYGPLFLMIERAVVTLAGITPYWSAVAFRLVAIIGVALMAHYVPRLAAEHGISGAGAMWLAVMNPLVLLHFVFGAHNDALMVGVMLAGLHAAMAQRPLRAVVLLAAAVSIKPIALVLVPFAALAYIPRDAGFLRRLRAYVLGGTATLGLVVLSGAAIGVGVGWVNALTTPGSVRTWLSPTTAIGMTIGLVGDVFGAASLDLTAVAVVRTFGMVVAVGLCLFLLLRPQGRSPARGAALTLATIIGLGPVVQPWYLLWALPLVAVSGLRRPWHLKAIVLGTAFFVFYGLSEPTATSDSHLDLIDSLGIVLAVVSVLLVLLASPRERTLVLGTQFGTGLTPADPGARLRAESRVLR